MSPRCVPCDRHFGSDKALQQHKRESSAHEFDCKTCDRHFGSDKALAQHLQNAAVHAQDSDSDDCDRSDDSEEALQQHLFDSPTYAPSFECECCDRLSSSKEAADQHLRDSAAHVLSFEHPTILTIPSQKQQPTTKQKPRTKLGPTEKWSIYSSLHDDVCDLLHEDNLFFSFYEEDDDDSCINNYHTNIMGSFTCCNTACLAVWRSGQIAITIRKYSNERYNARVYYQSCKRCWTTSEPQLDHSYAERVAYRLKKWSGVQVERLPFSGQSNGPHRSDLCEGCKQGHCGKMGRRF